MVGVTVMLIAAKYVNTSHGGDRVTLRGIDYMATVYIRTVRRALYVAGSIKMLIRYHYFGLPLLPEEWRHHWLTVTTPYDAAGCQYLLSHQ